MPLDCQSSDWRLGFQDRVAGHEPDPELYGEENYRDGYFTADAEAGHCTLVCGTDGSENPEDHRELCGMRFKDVS